MSEINSERRIDKKKYLDLLYYVILAITFIVSFIVENLLIFLLTFVVLLLLNSISNAKRKKAELIKIKQESAEKDSPEIKDLKSFLATAKKKGVYLTSIIVVLFLALQVGLDNPLFGNFTGTDLLITLTMIIIAFMVWQAYKVNKLQEQRFKNISISEHIGSRMEWVDQFRGLVVIFLIIAAITWELSGSHIGDIGDPNNPPIGPTYLNHGWRFAEFDGWPNIITIIDIGQQILMFIVGFVGALAYYNHRKKEGELGALLHVFRRFLALMILAIVVEGELFEGNFDLTDWNVVSVFWTSTFPNLAWGSLISLLLVALLKSKPDKRFIIAVCIMAAYSILFEIEAVQNWQWTIGSWVIFKVPWNTINHISIAILGTCTYDWCLLKTNEDPDYGWRKRILPIGSFMWIGVWLLDFLQPAEHHDATTTLSMMAIATSMFILFLFYMLERLKFKVPGLSELGKNILLMFLLTGLWGYFLHAFSRQMFVDYPITALILVGIVPLMTQILFAWALSKYRIIVKF